MDDAPKIGEVVAFQRTWKNEHRADGKWEAGAGGKDPLFVSEPAVRQRLLTFIQAGMHYRAAARATGIGRNTLSEWKRRGLLGEEPYAQFWGEVETAEAFSEARLVTIWSGHAAHDYRAARDLLRVRFPERWNINHVSSGEVEQPELEKPRDDIEQMSEIMAAYEEAGIRLDEQA